MTMHPTTEQVQARPQRVSVIDIARGTALVAMAVYHFAWDLEFFGYVEPGMTAYGGWKLFARCIASSFLFLVGVSLVLAHAKGIRWPGYWRRLAMVVAAALAISVATWIAMPNTFIFFGILHQIALASVLGLAFLRLPPVLTLVVAALVIAAPHYLRSEFFNQPLLLWVGLSTAPPRSNDFVPLLPWFGAVLIGIGAARLALKAGLFDRLARLQPGRWSQPLSFFGRHSLAFYLVHQPVLIGLVWTLSQVFPAPVETREVGFLKSCQVSCEQSRDTEFCSRYCVCMLDELQKDDSLDRLYAADPSPELKAHVGDAADMCSRRTDNPMIDGGTQ
ncbi:DUF1624 domain-containing protein [Aminobacter sp. HY435]|uniref:DUF1624 domain-containing protein n=1 Tax=Aminobacter sp. HY435 TaxID=2970917 RepID=UPI0022B99C68|nr:DUF1624 domain-containing protein [Aminobacter sp. HY435]